MVARCAVPFLCELNVERNVLERNVWNRLGQEEENKYFILFIQDRYVGRVMRSFGLYSMKVAEGKYVFLGEANTCL